MFVNMAVNKKKMLLAMIGGVVAGVAVTFITAVGSLSENLILQEISSFVMDMMLPFIIWLILTPSTNKGYDRACFTCAYRPGLRKLIKPFVWAYWGSCISALCMVVLQTSSNRKTVSCWKMFDVSFVSLFADPCCNLCCIQI